MTALKDELGDLLFQVVVHAQMATEAGSFTFHDVVDAICEKMARRHPHVFGDADMRSAEEQTQAWEEQKAAEREQKGAASILDDVPVGLPALTRAVKLQKRAARVGFDWTDIRAVIAKLAEESEELVAELDDGDADRIESEFGDLLFVVANLSRHLKVDPEAALRRANRKFVTRFQFIEQSARKADRPLAEHTLDEMEALWRAAKELE